MFLAEPACHPGPTGRNIQTATTRWPPASTSTGIRKTVLLRQRPGRQRGACGHEQVLAPVEHVRRGGCPMHGRAHLVSPEQLAVARVESQQIAISIAAEDQA